MASFVTSVLGEVIVAVGYWCRDSVVHISFISAAHTDSIVQRNNLFSPVRQPLVGKLMIFLTCIY